jgi:arylformamidase
MSPVHDPAWFDSQYNNRARVPESIELMAAWTAASAQARSRMNSQLDLRYGDTPAESLDVFMPGRKRRASAASRASAGGKAAPMLVFIHGGYWRALDKADHSHIAEAFTAKGYGVVVPNYALCPSVTMETIALQMARAVAWTWRHARSFGGDPGRIVVAGHSAGGHLAAMLLCCDWPRLAPDLPAGLLRSALSLSGLFDLEPIRRTAFLQQDLRLTPQSVRRLSPVRFPAPTGRLACLVGGLESEEFIRQNGLLRKRWGPAVVPVCESVEGANHFSVLDSLARDGGQVHRRALELLDDAS